MYMHVCACIVGWQREKWLSMNVHMCMYQSVYVYICTYLYCVCLFYQDCESEFNFAVSLGCFHDNVRAEPGSWLVVDMIPVFDKKKAGRAGRPQYGPHGTARRRIGLMHQCLSALLEGWNVLSAGNKILQWADGTWRRTRLMITGFFMDQPEADIYCCDTAQSCKLCNCPKHRLHEPVEHPLNTPMQSRQRLRELQTDITFLLYGCFAVKKLHGPLLTIATQLCMRSVGLQWVEFTSCPMRCGTSLAVMCSIV
jgi:hypothetical protein